MMLRTVCVGKCLFGTPCPSSSQGIYHSSFWCVSVYSVCVIGILVFVKWKIQVQFIRKILAMKLRLKKKKRFFKHWVATKCSLNSKKNWLWWKSFIFAYVIRENFFFLFTILTLRETKICLGESLKLTLVFEIHTQLTLRLQTWVI